MHQKTKIFLSHTFLDINPIKQRIIHDLEMLSNVDLWRAESRISAGDLLTEKLSQAISESDYFIQIVSEKQGSWSNVERQLALANQLKTQNYNVITLVTGGSDNGSPFVGQMDYGIVINFKYDYEYSFKKLQEFINVTYSDSLVKFDLDLVTEGHSVFILTNEVNEKLIDFFSRNPNELKKINRRLFEEMVAELFYGFGYAVELTQQTRDGGRDIIAIKNNELKAKYLIECKRPDPGNTVGIKPVRELFGVKQDEKATKAILATTSYFSKDALQFFERNKWELEPKDFDGLLDWIKIYKQKKNIA